MQWYPEALLLHWSCSIVKHFPLITSGQFDYDVIQEIPEPKHKSFQFDIITYGDRYYLQSIFVAGAFFDLLFILNLSGVEHILADFLPKPYVISAMNLLPRMNVAALKISETEGNTSYLASFRSSDVRIGLSLINMDRNTGLVKILKYYPELRESDGSLIHAQE